MKCELIAVGTELLLGNIVNTNAQYLSEELAALGFNMYYQSVVGDNFERVKDCVLTAVNRSQIVIMTGGLGPTPDDLSKEAASSALGLELYYDNDALLGIENFFTNIGRKMSESNRKQALFPKERCVIFPNKNGTAPGCALTAENGAVVILMPGVPYEMQTMFKEYVKPYLASLSNSTIYSLNLLVAGLGESLLTSLIPDYINSTDPTVSPYCKPGLVNLRITSASTDVETARKKCDLVANKLSQKFGKNVCGINTPSIEHAVVDMLQSAKLKLATAESCTAGKISAAITNVPGASKVFDFGASTYSNEMKQKLLCVNAETLKTFGAVSAETACQMAKGILQYANSDIGLAVTGVAGPGADGNKPAGLVYIALCDKQNVWVERLMVGKAENDREKVRNTTVTHALDLVRRYLAYYPAKMPNLTSPVTPICFSAEDMAINEIQNN